MCRMDCDCSHFLVSLVAALFLQSLFSVLSVNNLLSRWGVNTNLIHTLSLHASELASLLFRITLLLAVRN